jgi:hypothetical protein
VSKSLLANVKPFWLSAESATAARRTRSTP